MYIYMNYEHKYLKYKAKYAALKAELNGPLNPNDEIQKSINKYNRYITNTERQIRNATLRMKRYENEKNIGIDKLRKNNASTKEIEDFIKSQDEYINNQKKIIEVENNILAGQKRRLEQNKNKLNDLLKN